jgi:hypothetical protein
MSASWQNLPAITDDRLIGCNICLRVPGAQSKISLNRSALFGTTTSFATADPKGICVLPPKQLTNVLEEVLVIFAIMVPF